MYRKMTTNNDSQYSRHVLVVFVIILLISVLLLLSANLISPKQLSAQQQATRKPSGNAVVVELFYRSDSQQSIEAEQYLKKLGLRRGIEVKAHDVLKDRDQLKRLWQLSKRFGLEKAKVPTFYLCDRLIVGFQDASYTGARFDEMLRIKAYVRPGCKHCIAGRQFLDDLVQRWPALSIQYLNVVADSAARAEAQDLAARYKVQVPSFPCIHVAGRLVVGFQTAETTGANIEDLFPVSSHRIHCDDSAKCADRIERKWQEVEECRGGPGLQPPASFRQRLAF